MFVVPVLTEKERGGAEVLMKMEEFDRRLLKLV